MEKKNRNKCVAVQLSQSNGIVSDGSSLYIADTEYHRIRKILPILNIIVSARINN